MIYPIHWLYANHTSGTKINIDRHQLARRAFMPIPYKRVACRRRRL